MIVKSIPAGWEVIYQRAHGLLAAELAFHWKISNRPPHFMKTLLAIAEHDDGVPESQLPQNLTPAGAPRDFRDMVSGAKQYRNVMEISASKSRWNALMTSLHMSFLYESVTSEDKDIREFMEEQHHFQKRIIKELNTNRKEAEKAYQFVEWCDALSLLLCMDQIPPQQRKIEISSEPSGKMSQLWQDEDECLRIEPWPFESDSFKVEIEYRELHQLQFKNVSELHEGLRKAAVGVRTWTFARS
jgi:hypothetical protein